MALISCLTGRKKMRTNENFTEIFGSDEEQLRDKQMFVRNLGQLLSQTGTGVMTAELEDKDTVVIYFVGGTKRVNIACDSYLAIIKDVVDAI